MPEISGYRELTPEEIDLINRIKQKEAEVLALHAEVFRKLGEQDMAAQEERYRMRKARSLLWCEKGRHHIETGFMELVRSVAQPQPIDAD